jgi:hypothetical protein
MPLTTFLVKKEFSLRRPVLLFQPTVNFRAIDKQSKQCQNHISQLGKMHSAGTVLGLARTSGFLPQQRNSRNGETA